MATRKSKALKAPPTEKPSVAARALHRKAIRHNWDNGLWKLMKILKDPACDHGTALLIYWLGSPGYYQKYAKVSEAKPYEKPAFNFLLALEKRLLARDFATELVLFNPRFDRTTINAEGYDWTASAPEKMVRPIPKALLEPSMPDPEWEARR